MEDRDAISGKGRSFRAVTYNVHGCRGGDGLVNPARVAEVLAGLDADIIALQELDVGRSRSNGLDQALAIATLLRMEAHFHPVHQVQGGHYGNAIISRWPMALVRRAELPSLGEPRGAMWVTVKMPWASVEVLNTHLGLRRRERMMQVQALAGAGWLGDQEIEGKPTLLLGDLNAVPSSLAYRMLSREFGRGQEARTPTFPSRFPLLQLDHSFARNGLSIVNRRVPRGLNFRIASDHLPLVAEIAAG